jgi:archaeal arginyl aminopeptidase
MKALIISADEFEDAELLVPLYRFREEGIGADVASLRPGKIRGMHGYEVAVDKTFADVIAGDYDVLVLPGGKAPLAVRKEQKAIEIVKDFFRRNKPVAAICHGQQTLVTADLLKGRRATCYSNMVRELQDAGALFEDREVVVDGNLVSSRQPSDLPAFMREMMGLLKMGAKAAPGRKAA